MGLKDLFSSSARSKSRLDKHIKTVTNPYTQSADRYHAMEQMLADGSEAALVGIFRRFTIVSTKSIEDEEEKGWAYRQLSGLGEKVLPAARAFCLEHDNVAWVLRIIEDVADEAQEWELLDALLERHPPGYERDPKKKLQVLTHLADIDDPRVALAALEQVHDLHIWQITSGMPMLSAHVLVGPDSDCHGIRRQLEELLENDYEIDHTTLQVEHSGDQRPIPIDQISRPSN